MELQKVILLVDDTPDNLTILCELLKSQFKLKIATTGEKAIQIANAESPPDLILLDVIMPGMNGYEVCRMLKKSPTTSNIPIIFLTGLSTPEDIKFGEDLGGVGFLTKPINPTDVLKRVHEVLQNNHK